MDKLIVHGGTPIHGVITVSGSKNASLPILAATLLTEEDCVIRRVPDVSDTNYMVQILTGLGADVERFSGTVRVTAADIGDTAPYDIVRRMRASVCVMGPLLARKRRCVVALPGGCVIGDRPVDLHIRGLEALGAKAEIEGGNIILSAPDGLRGSTIDLCGSNGPTVLGTDNVMMAATLAEGITTITSAACEPEVVDLADFLNAMGAKISGAGTPVITIEGVEKLKGCVHNVIPDRIEAGTFMAAAALAGEGVTLRRIRHEHLTSITNTLRKAGHQVHFNDVGDACTVHRGDTPMSAEIVTEPYPGYPTDMQAQMAALFATTPGTSIVVDTIFPQRFMYCAELKRMGADITVGEGKAVIKGVEKLSAAPVMASDLRASAALVLAALTAKGSTEILRLYHIDRGYDHIDEKLRAMGAHVEREREKGSAWRQCRPSSTHRSLHQRGARGRNRQVLRLEVQAPHRSRLVDLVHDIQFGAEVRGVIGTADQRTAGDMAETFREGDLLELVENGRLHIFDHRQMPRRRAQVLAHGKNGDIGLEQIVHRPQDLVALFPEAEHDAALGGDLAVHHCLRLLQHGQAAVVLCAGADQRGEPFHRFEVVVEDVRPRFHHHLQRPVTIIEIRYQHLDHDARIHGPDRFDGLLEMLGAAIPEVIPGDGGNDDMAELHPAGRLRHAERFVRLEGIGLGGLHRAEAAGTGAFLTRDHEGGGALAPAFPAVRALGLLADGHQLQVRDEGLGGPEYRVIRQADLDPGRLLVLVQTGIHLHLGSVAAAHVGGKLGGGAGGVNDRGTIGPHRAGNPQFPIKGASGPYRFTQEIAMKTGNSCTARFSPFARGPGWEWRWLKSSSHTVIPSPACPNAVSTCPTGR